MNNLEQTFWILLVKKYKFYFVLLLPVKALRILVIRLPTLLINTSYK